MQSLRICLIALVFVTPQAEFLKKGAPTDHGDVPAPHKTALTAINQMMSALSGGKMTGESVVAEGAKVDSSDEKGELVEEITEDENGYNINVHKMSKAEAAEEAGTDDADDDSSEATDSDESQDDASGESDSATSDEDENGGSQSEDEEGGDEGAEEGAEEGADESGAEGGDEGADESGDESADESGDEGAENAADDAGEESEDEEEDGIIESSTAEEDDEDVSDVSLLQIGASGASEIADESDENDESDETDSMSSEDGDEIQDDTSQENDLHNVGEQIEDMMDAGGAGEGEVDPNEEQMVEDLEAEQEESEASA